MKLSVGDVVQLKGNPFDEQIPEEMAEYVRLKGVDMRITDAKDVDYYGTSGQWVKTNLIEGWADSVWFTRP